MVDSPSDQMSLVRFRARPFHYCISLQQAESVEKCPFTCSVYSLDLQPVVNLYLIFYGEGERVAAYHSGSAAG